MKQVLSSLNDIFDTLLKALSDPSDEVIILSWLYIFNPDCVIKLHFLMNFTIIINAIAIILFVALSLMSIYVIFHFFFAWISGDQLGVSMGRVGLGLVSTWSCQVRNPLTCLRPTDRTNPSISDQWMDGRAQMGHWVSRITKIHTHPPSPKKYIYNHKNPQNFDLQQSNIDLHVASHRIKKSQKQKRLQICLDPFFFLGVPDLPRTWITRPTNLPRAQNCLDIGIVEVVSGIEIRHCLM